MGLFNLSIDNNVFGLDIGYETLKLVQLRKSQKEISLVGFAEVPLTERILERDSFKNKTATANLIREACRKAIPQQIRAKKIVSALPETFVFSKTIQMPKMTPEEYATAVPIEAAQYLPIPVEEVYLDFQTLITHPDEPLADLLLVASPKKLVDEYVEVTKMAGFELVALETKPIAVGRAISVIYPLNGVLIAEIGTEITRVSIWDTNNIRLITSIGLGKNQISGPAASKQEMLDNPSMITIVDELLNAIRYHQNRDYKPNPVEKILLCGSGANVAGLKEFLEKEIKIKTEIVKPKLSQKTELTSDFITSYGLALRGEYE